MRPVSSRKSSWCSSLQLKPGFSKSNLEYDQAFQVGLCTGSLPADLTTKIADARKKLLDGTIKIGLEPAKA